MEEQVKAMEEQVKAMEEQMKAREEQMKQMKAREEQMMKQMKAREEQMMKQMKAREEQMKEEKEQMKEEKEQMKEEKEQMKEEMKALQDELTNTLESASEMSQSKKKRFIGWCDIVPHFGFECDSSEFNMLVRPEDFVELDIDKQTKALSLINLQQHRDAIYATVTEALGMSTLPSPSNMAWSDVDRILVGSIPQSDNSTVNIASCQKNATAVAMLKQVCKLVYNHSEMDATARVLMLVMEAAWDMDNVTIKLQPSFEGHSTFTDFLIHINQFSFIEVKRVEITTDLEMPTKQTAQALREAHIILLEKNAEHVTFALTNFRSWSFGRAKKVGVQIQMDKTCALLYNELNHGKIVCMIKHLFKGTWPN